MYSFVSVSVSVCLSVCLCRHLSQSVIALDRSSRWYHVSAQLTDIDLCWLAKTGVSMRESPHENLAYELILASSAMPSMSCSSYSVIDHMESRVSTNVWLNHGRRLNKVTSWVSPNISYILVTWITIRLLCKSWRWRNILSREMPSSPDTLRLLLAGFASMAWSTTLIWLSRWGSCNPSEIFWTIWLLYCNQLRIHLSYNRCF